MALRWVVNPVVEWMNGDRVRRRPKVSVLADPSLLSLGVGPGGPVWVQKTYRHSSVINETEWCLSLVRSLDFSNIDNDPECRTLLGSDYEDKDNHLEVSPKARAYTEKQMADMEVLLDEKKADRSKLTRDVPLWKWVRQLGRAVDPTFPGPRGTWVGA